MQLLGKMPVIACNATCCTIVLTSVTAGARVVDGEAQGAKDLRGAA